MGIPRIDPYPMPRGGDVVKNRAPWQLDPRRAVLLIHDMQQYFLDYYDTQASPVTELVENIGAVRERCAALGVPIVYTMQSAKQTLEERGLLLDLWGPGLTAHPQKEPIVRELSPRRDDVILTKWRYSAFQRTELLPLMRDKQRDQLIICGVYAHIGCLLTACEAFMNDIQPFFVTDATADFSQEKHEMAIQYVAQRCGVALSTREVLAALGAERGALTLESLRGEISELLEQPASEISDREPLLELGLDSIRLMTLVERLQSTGIDVTFIELAERPTIAEWWELLSSRLPHRASAHGA